MRADLQGHVSRPPVDSRNFTAESGKAKTEVMKMSYVSPALRGRFESLSIDLKNEILKRDVRLYTLQDLIHCLENIVAGH